MIRAYTLPDVLTRYALPLDVETDFGTFLGVDRATVIDAGHRVELHNGDGLHVIDGQTWARVVNARSLDADDTEADEALHLTMQLEARGTETISGTDRALMNKYRVTLTDQNGNVITMPFFTGMGWDHDPSIGDVLQCLASDLSVETPEDAEEMGLGIRAWRELEAQNDRVKAFFGDRVDILLQFDADERYSAAATGNAVTL